MVVRAIFAPSYCIYGGSYILNGWLPKDIGVQMFVYNDLKCNPTLRRSHRRRLLGACDELAGPRFSRCSDEHWPLLITVIRRLRSLSMQLSV